MKNHHVSTVGVKTIDSFIWSRSVLGFSATSPSSQTSPERASLSQAPHSTAASRVVASSVVSCGGGKVILQTVPAVMCGFNGCSKVVQYFLDPGSQTSFVSVGSVQEFGLDGNVEIGMKLTENSPSTNLSEAMVLKR